MTALSISTRNDSKINWAVVNASLSLHILLGYFIGTLVSVSLLTPLLIIRLQEVEFYTTPFYLMTCFSVACFIGFIISLLHFKALIRGSGRSAYTSFHQHYSLFFMTVLAVILVLYALQKAGLNPFRLSEDYNFKYYFTDMVLKFINSSMVKGIYNAVSSWWGPTEDAEESGMAYMMSYIFKTQVIELALNLWLVFQIMFVFSIAVLLVVFSLSIFATFMDKKSKHGQDGIQFELFEKKDIEDVDSHIDMV